MGIGVIVALAGAVLAFFLGRASPVPTGIAVVVGGEQVTIDELDRRIEVVEAVYGIERPSDGPGQDRFGRDIAASLAVATLLEQAADERGIEPGEEVVERTLADVVAQRYPEDGRDGFTRALADRGVSEAEVRREVQRQLTNQILFLELTAGVEVTDADARAAYGDLTGAERMLPEVRELRHLVVATEDEASSARRELEDGRAFGEVVVERSLDGSTREDEGRLGALTREDLDERFAEVAFETAEGELFGPVRTDLGWHVGRVEEVRPAAEATFEDLGPTLADRIALERSLARWRAWLEERFEMTDIRYADAYRPEAPDRIPGADQRPPGTDLAPDGRATDQP
ncbi:peptidylprolyl isomerase [Nitriliruptor alkaliphilus]|uniref:peptidylprolyl isomerase n=1 Tax=Nitriliruptor alkaliphilus TaxID=427918 RepID=UPI0012ED05CD|nr:peptidylprolyl isomerase [Nitriliruptor alkaliphilus]